MQAQHRRPGYPPEGLLVQDSPPGAGAMRANERGALRNAVVHRCVDERTGNTEITFGNGRIIILPKHIQGML